MKRFWLISLFALVANVANAETIVLDANESPPYWENASPTHGLGGELISAISEAAGLDSRIQFMPLKRMIDNTTNNDLGNPVFYMENQDFSAIIPIAISQVALYRYKPKQPTAIQFKTLKALQGYRVGALSGTIKNRKLFEQLGIHIETSYTQESLFKKLHYGRLDFVLEIDLIGQQMIAKLFPTEKNNFVAVELPHSVSPIAIMLDRNYPNANVIAARYREGLAKIIKNGRYSEIINRYYEQPPASNRWFKELNRFTRLYENLSS